jgi:hypothetical protein
VFACVNIKVAHNPDSRKYKEHMTRDLVEVRACANSQQTINLGVVDQRAQRLQQITRVGHNDSMSDCVCTREKWLGSAKKYKRAPFEGTQRLIERAIVTHDRTQSWSYTVVTLSSHFQKKWKGKLRTRQVQRHTQHQRRQRWRPQE